MLQTAFKRAAPNSAPDSDTQAGSANGNGDSGQPLARDSIDWDSVKSDDKMLVFQVC